MNPVPAVAGRNIRSAVEETPKAFIYSRDERNEGMVEQAELRAKIEDALTRLEEMREYL